MATENTLAVPFALRVGRYKGLDTASSIRRDNAQIAASSFLRRLLYEIAPSEHPHISNAPSSTKGGVGAVTAQITSLQFQIGQSSEADSLTLAVTSQFSAIPQLITLADLATGDRLFRLAYSLKTSINAQQAAMN